METVEEIRQHNHAVVRSTRSKKSFVLCMTTMNWDNFPILPPHVLLSLATEASILEEAENDFLSWAATQGFDPDSRGAERRFRQTLTMVTTLKGVLGERAYRELLVLQADATAVMRAAQDEQDDEEQDEDEDEDEDED